MPIVSIVMLKGPEQAAKENMYREAGDALRRTLRCRPDQVPVMVREMEAENFAIAGASVSSQRKT